MGIITRLPVGKEKSKSKFSADFFVAMWLAILTCLLMYCTFALQKENSKLTKENAFLKSNRLCRSVVKEKKTGLVTLMDSTGNMVAHFYDTTYNLFR